MPSVSPNDIRAGGAFVELFLKDEAALQGLNRFAKRFQAMARKIQAAGRQMAITALVAATPFVAATKIYADYTKQLAFVATMVDGNTELMKEFSEGVRSMSVEFGLATSDLTESLFTITSSLFAPTEALGILREASKLATAGFASVADSTLALTTVMRAYGLAAKDAGDVSDTLFAIMKTGKLTFEQLSRGIGLVAATSAQAGVPLQEIGAAIDVITLAGVPFDTTITSLRNILKVFINIKGEAKEAAEAIQGLGPISIEGIKEKGFLTILKELAALPAQTRAKIFPELRSQTGILGFAAGLPLLPKVLEELANKTGIVDRNARMVLDTFGKLVDKIKQAGILVLSVVGEVISEELSETGKSVLSIAKGFGAWVKENKAWVLGAVNVVFWLGKIGIAMLVAGKAMAIYAGIQIALTGSMSKLLNMLASMAIVMGAFDLATRGIASELKAMGQAGEDAAEGVGKMFEEGVFASLGESEKHFRERLARISTLKKKLQKELGKLRGDNKLTVFRSRTFILPGLPGSRGQSGSIAGEAVHEENRIADAIKRTKDELKLVFDAEERIKKDINDIYKRRQDELNIVKKQTEELKKQGALTRRGFFAGFYHTPVLSYSSTQNTDPDTVALESIVENTSVLNPGGSGKPLAEQLKESLQAT